MANGRWFRPSPFPFDSRSFVPTGMTLTMDSQAKPKNKKSLPDRPFSNRVTVIYLG